MREWDFTCLFDFEQVGALKDHLNEIYGSVGSSLGGGGSSARYNYYFRKHVSKNLIVSFLQVLPLSFEGPSAARDGDSSLSGKAKRDQVLIHHILQLHFCWEFLIFSPHFPGRPTSN